MAKYLRVIKNKDVKPKYFTYNEKSIIFSPLAHFSQEELYFVRGN